MKMLTVRGCGHNSHTHASSVNRKIFLHAIYYLVQAAVSVVQNLEVVRYSGAAIALHIIEISVGACSSV